MLSSNADGRRIILGAAVGYEPEQARTFIESLRSVGYAGDVMMLVGPFQSRLKTYLRGQGVRPISAWCIRRIHGPIFTYRFEIFARYLRKSGNRYDQVLISDVRDVLFQRHPFEGITDPECHFFLEGAAKTIGSEPTNMAWMQMFLTPDQVAKISNCRISCCGVSLGGTDSMMAYLTRLAAHLRAVPLKLKRRHGADTAFHNLMAHLTHEVNCLVVENNVHVATMGIEAASIYRRGDDGLIRTIGGQLPAILHQYDRVQGFQPTVAA